MGFATTSTKLMTVLNTIDSAVLPAKFEYMEQSPTAFPCSFLIAEGGPPERTVDTISNETLMTFKVLALFPIEETQAATQKALALLDAIAAKLRLESNRTLEGTVHYCGIAGYAHGATDQWAHPVVQLEVRIEARALASTQ